MPACVRFPGDWHMSSAVYVSVVPTLILLLDVDDIDDDVNDDVFSLIAFVEILTTGTVADPTTSPVVNWTIILEGSFVSAK